MRFKPIDIKIEELKNHLSKRERIDNSRLSFIVSPYRISPLGAHIDHQGGPVLGMTIDAATVMAYFSVPEPRIRLYSMNYPGITEFNLDNIKRTGRDDWGRYIRGGAAILLEHTELKNGFVGVVRGDLPASGLSSSASLGICSLWALAGVNGLELSPSEYVELDRRIENDYLGLQNGILDQSSIAYGRKDSLLHIDTISGEVESHPARDRGNDYKILILYSGTKRELTSSGFNARVKECKEAAMLLGMMGRVESPEKLADIPHEVFEQNSKRLPDLLLRRARHFFTEVKRVGLGLGAWDCGDYEGFGRLMNESCRSSLDDYEAGSEELSSIHKLMSEHDLVYGSRFSGGGYGGSVVALVHPDFSDSDASSILESYVRKFPEYEGDAAVYFAVSDDGVRFI